MVQERYILKEYSLGDVFQGKTIIADTHEMNLCASILKEGKDPKTGKRFYIHVPYPRKAPDDPHKEEYPDFELSKSQLDRCLPPGKYLIKVVNRHNKAKSYGSVMLYNEGAAYKALMGEGGLTSDTHEKATDAEKRLVALEKALKDYSQRIERIEKALRLDTPTSYS